VIYGLSSDGYFACRKCLRLGYQSESESPADRAWRRLTKLESLLAEDGAKPTGMRWRTYERIVAQIDGQEERRDNFLAPGLMRLLMRLETAGTRKGR